MSIGERGPFLPAYPGAPPERLIKRGEQGQTFFHWHASICFREGVPSIFRQGLKYVQYRTKIWIFQFIRRQNTNACLVCFYDISVFFCEKAPRLAARGLLRIEPVLWGGPPAGRARRGGRKGTAGEPPGVWDLPLRLGVRRKHKSDAESRKPSAA